MNYYSESKIYRPWGKLSWLLNKLPINKWDLITCLSTEDRDESVISTLKNVKKLAGYNLATINDNNPDYSYELAEKINAKSTQWRSRYGNPVRYKEFDLIDDVGSFVGWVNEIIDTSSDSVILDISAFPKRYFFPAVKFLLNSTIENIVVTYSSPASYNNGPLSEDPEDAEPIPFFVNTEFPEPEINDVFIGVGHASLGLTSFLNADGPEATLLFPFPPGPPSYNLNWNFVRELSDKLALENNIVRVSAVDVSDVFDRLIVKSKFGERSALLAPYGPKPISLAMCLYAIETGFAVIYTQPRTYSLSYSTGFALDDNGSPLSYAYGIRLNGVDYYKLEKHI